jgi:hypothetical protein
MQCSREKRRVEKRREEKRRDMCVDRMQGSREE